MQLEPLDLSLRVLRAGPRICSLHPPTLGEAQEKMRTQILNVVDLVKVSGPVNLIILLLIK